MKKFIKIISTVLLCIMVLLGVIWFTVIGDGRMTPGIYKIVDYDAYPDAYIEVTEDSIQFFNIDLNAIYQEEQKKVHSELMSQNPDLLSLSEEEVQRYSNLNGWLVDNAYIIDYKLSGEGIKEGTFLYTYIFRPGNWVFGLGLEYNSFHKTINICNVPQELTFKKQ